VDIPAGVALTIAGLVLFGGSVPSVGGTQLLSALSFLVCGALRTSRLWRVDSSVAVLVGFLVWFARDLAPRECEVLVAFAIPRYSRSS